MEEDTRGGGSIVRWRKKNILFDTSALNHLADAHDAERIRELIVAAGWRPLITLANVIELLRTRESARRAQLCCLAQALHEDGRYRLLDAPDRLIGNYSKAWAAQESAKLDVTV